MRRLILAILLAACVGTHAGCIIPAYSGDPVKRTQELIYTSENLRMALEEWQRIWFLDMPSHLTPYPTHGGVI